MHVIYIFYGLGSKGYKLIPDLSSLSFLFAHFEVLTISNVCAKKYFFDYE